MRACYVLLVAATSLLAVSDAAVSAASVQSTLSKVVSPDAAQPIQAEQAAVSSTQRFLRSHKILDDDEEDVDSLDDVLFKQWDANKYDMKHVASQLKIDVDGPLDQTYAKLWMGYQAFTMGTPS
ncbi:hypothetical protein PF001_g24196 [Phytophthora fragariae]|uniref:RxLR effector protein n=1 Tax=Phytophthora fragariae TaxID=53985 RepID=A0A6A4BVZ1_9STRA|nr:hypothetical protein PF009_g22412 [Phytophthora fragariae]KAE9094391.1 hypothetical protein PF006_g24226 [Phytophthora fragariae]KAE9280514.1 hypothetical protein PF001_g24196 [Phytophthora fragariae]